jgi:hypothetical protein
MKNIGKSIGDVKAKNQSLIKDYQSRLNALEYIENSKFNVNHLQERENGFLIYTDDFKVVDDYEIITVDYKKDWADFGPYEKDELISESFKKAFNFFKKEKFGKFDLEILLKEDYMLDNQLNILYSFQWNREKSYFSIPNSHEKVVDFYKIRGMNNKLIGEISNVIKLTEKLIRG